jgi:sugar phosphate isomerase/epimerase
MGETAEAINGLGVEHVHLALPAALEHPHFAMHPAREEGGTGYLEVVAKQGWTVTCTMMAFVEEDYSSIEAIQATGGIFPDETWERNRDLVVEAIGLTADMGVDFLSFHFGFIGQPGSASWNKLLERTRILAEKAAKRKVMLLMETGQETAEELKSFIEQLGYPAIGVNFDPANMILYDNDDPIKAVEVLAPWIKHVHIKDGVRPSSLSELTGEVPWGTGDVDTVAFLGKLEEIGYNGALAIEREAGSQRVDDIRSAIEQLVAYRG